MKRAETTMESPPKGEPSAGSKVTDGRRVDWEAIRRSSERGLRIAEEMRARRSARAAQEAVISRSTGEDSDGDR